MRSGLQVVPSVNPTSRITLKLSTPDTPLVQLGVIRSDNTPTVFASPSYLPWLMMNSIRVHI